MTGPSIFRDPNGVLGRDVAPTVIRNIAPFAWVVVAIMLLLVVAAADSRIGGWLLIVVVISMLGVAHKRNLI